jgi:DNA-binding response OmpR family regulator
LKKFLIITQNAGNFLRLAEGLSDKNTNEIIWADSLTAAHAAASGSIDLIIIDEKVDGRTGPDIAMEMIRVNAMANLALVSGLSPEEFHEATEGLGIMAQLPLTPDAKDAERLLSILTALS